MMRQPIRRRVLAVAVAAFCAIVAASLSLQGQETKAPLLPKVDALFARWTTTTPGCAVGVSSGGTIVLEKAYGMADLEHDVPNIADTIFEAGSVSKQFTAAAVLLLAREGKLSLDDPARKYIPELPDYGWPLTIRHMLQHTSGLRDWGEIESVAGWPRTSRVYTHAHVLDIVSRQRALNFEPGTKWSYCNTGYNLAAIIVSRVSGQPFAEFCRQRIFEPLGMTHTSWRDDFRRVVKGRAIAYDAVKDGYRQDMPFEDIHGNGGLLTTVGDLLRWNENAVAQKVGDAEFLREELQPGHFNDRRPHDYAMGLFIKSFMGLREVNHSGSTAGYRAYLTRYPDQHVSVAVLCNVSSGAAERYAHGVAALCLADAIKAKHPASGKVDLGNDDRLITWSSKPLVGLYRNTVTGVPLSLAAENVLLVLEGGTAPNNLLTPVSDSTYQSWDATRTYHFDGKGGLRVAVDNGTSETFERVDRATPTGDELKALVGTYSSDEAEVNLTVSAEGSELKVRRRPDTTLALKPVYKDAFSAQGLGLVRFHRDASGRVVGLSVTLDRVWDLRFDRSPTR
jgi:CubicO group peptidase (beta-lactamase class C family)